MKDTRFTTEEFNEYVSNVKPCSEETYHRMLIACLKMIADALDNIDSKLNKLEDIKDELDFIGKYV